jgi:hypothetical protein
VARGVDASGAGVATGMRWAAEATLEADVLALRESEAVR